MKTVVKSEHTAALRSALAPVKVKGQALKSTIATLKNKATAKKSTSMPGKGKHKAMPSTWTPEPTEPKAKGSGEDGHTSKPKECVATCDECLQDGRTIHNLNLSETVGAVLDTAELRAGILLHLSVKRIFLAQSVCRTFRDSMTQLPDIQEKLRLRLSKDKVKTFANKFENPELGRRTTTKERKQRAVRPVQ